MKILHVITSLRTGGAEKLMVELLPRLKQYGYEVDLLLFDGTNTPFREALENKGIKVYDLGVGGSVYSIVKLFKLRKYLNGYDFIHTHNTSPQFFVALLKLIKGRQKLITTEHGGSNRRRSIKGFKYIDKWMYSQYNRIICIADKTKENLKSYLNSRKENIVVINNGIEVIKFAKANKATALNLIAPESKKIIMVAGFRWEKDQPTVIKSLKYLPEFFHLFLVGDGSRRKEYEELVDRERLTDRVHFLGIRNDVAELLRASDYVVMSSHFEGLSLSSVEGMCVGKPFLASNVDGLREVVEGAGILFPHEDANVLADEIMKLENNPEEYKAVAERCLERAKQYDISKMVDGYIKVYQSL